MKNCLVCGNDDNKVVFSWNGKGGTKDYVRKCAVCGLIYRDPQPCSGALSDKYETDYFQDYKKYYFDFRTRQYEYYMDIIEKYYKSKARVLDIGCAFGVFLNVARNRGWQVEGFDISDHAKKKAKELFDIDIVRKSSFKETSFEKESFDLVTMWDVLEHVPDPAEILKQIRPLIKKEGMLVIKVPNANETFMKIVKAIYDLSGETAINVRSKFEHHLFLFSVKSLALLLNKAGFKPVKIYMDVENLVIDDRKTLGSFIKAAVKRSIKCFEAVAAPLRSSIIVVARVF